MREGRGARAALLIERALPATRYGRRSLKIRTPLPQDLSAAPSAEDSAAVARACLACPSIYPRLRAAFSKAALCALLTVGPALSPRGQSVGSVRGVSPRGQSADDAAVSLQSLYPLPVWRGALGPRSTALSPQKALSPRGQSVGSVRGVSPRGQSAVW
eukprot:CAMPEP_0119400208 /NCGR_PEP_ID=MMETSP1334-20130426/141745_1 /TAXON_ID=127549 /ORGANISM="Calcidiscus leptoporus, Strain RCC1130" /LENGTH=157 /DNA_ID=CAMNT_0007424107 /DNA_START=60 /DNA_END=530 /DNA_ORIENTATION=-